MNQAIRVSVLLIGFLLLTAAGVLAQFDRAEVLGTVRDKTGAVVQNAVVMLINQETGIQSKATTDGNGNYDFINVRIGRYTITAELTGFRKFETKDVVVNVNARQRVDMELEVGAIAETVEVTDAAAILETDSSARGQIINTQQVVQLPLNGRNYSDLALLTTNIHRSPLAVAAATPREGAFNVNGMRSTYNNFLLDGLDNNAYGTSNQSFANQVAQPSPDAVAEFKVITNNYSAEYGRAGGAVVNVAMRSGTNQFHGTAYEFLRNTDLNAAGYIFGVRPLTYKKPTLQRNQFGLALGGPFLKSRMFFFTDYEGFRELQRALNFNTLPSMSDRSGVLPVPVVNPLTGTVYQAGTQIPVSTVNPFAAKVLNDLPAPTGPGRSNNHQLLLLTRDYYDKYDAKIDAQINNSTTGFVRFSQRKDNQYYQPTFPGPSGGGGNGYVRTMQQALGAGITWTVSADKLLEGRFGYSHVHAGKSPPFLGGASMESMYGVTGLPTFPELTGGLNTQNVTGFAGFGRQATNPQFQNPTGVDIKLNYSWIRGRHALKFGYEYLNIHTEVMDINPVYGLMGYAGQFTKPTCAQLGQPSNCTVSGDSSSYNLADFMFGLPSQIQLANYLVGNYRQHQHFMYAQDDFRVNSKLTLNLGLRWEFATPRWEKDNVLSNYDPKSNSMIKAKDGGLYDRTLVDPDYRDWAPRLGFAYSAMPKTVLRGGYGISYIHHNRVGSADLLGINGPQVVIATINQTPLVNGQPNPAFIRPQTGYPPGLTSPDKFVPANANVAYIPRNTRWPYVQTWYFSVQREIVKNTVLEVSYSGNHGVRIPIIADYNQAVASPPGPGLPIQSRRPNPTFGAITWMNPSGFNSYNGMAIRLEHRFSAGFYFLDSFTWSKALGNTEQALEVPTGGTVANVQNVYDLKNERGPSSFDVKINNVTSVVYQLPFGKGRQYLNAIPGALNAVFGNWQITSILSLNTGEPLNVFFTPNAVTDVTGRIPDYRGLSVARPNLIGDPKGSDGPASYDNYFNKAAFAIPTAQQAWGTLGRNALRMPFFSQWDLGIHKEFPLPWREGMNLQFRSEFFNILNHTNPRWPDCNFSNASFGTIRSTYPARQIQFALKVMF
jgi:hypothetical protein